MPLRLIFPISTSRVGRSYSIAEHSSAVASVACRELIQNALDARANLKASDGHCRVQFKTRELSMSEIPGIEEYRNALKKCQKTWRKNATITSYLKSIEQYALKDKVDTLLVIDNGSGFQNTNMEAILSEGIPEKQEGSSGSFGVGHLTAFGLSGLQYVFYASKDSNGKYLVAGHAILTVFEDEKKDLRSDHGYYLSDFIGGLHPFHYGNDFQDIPDFLREELNNLESSGAIIAVLGFNGFKSNQDSEDNSLSLSNLVLEAVAKNFAMAICSKELEVSVCPYGEKEAHIDKEKILNFLEFMAESETTTKSSIDGAKRTLDAIKTFSGSESIQENLDGEFKDCEIFLRNKASAHDVSVWRNGMLITRNHGGLSKRRFPGRKPFNAVVLLSGRSSPKIAHDLVKAAETPMHDQIQEGRLSNAEKQKLKKLFANLREWILKNALESGGESKDLYDDILLDSGTTTAEIRINRRAKIKVDDEDSDDGEIDDLDGDKTSKKSGEKSSQGTKGKKAIINPANKVNAGMQGQVVSKDGSYLLRIKPNRDIAHAVLELSVDTGQDDSCTGYIEEKQLKISHAHRKEDTSEKYPVMESGHIRLHNLRKDQYLNLKVVFDHPSDISKVAISGLLGEIKTANIVADTDIITK